MKIEKLNKQRMVSRPYGPGDFRKGLARELPLVLGNQMVMCGHVLGFVDASSVYVLHESLLKTNPALVGRE